MDLAEIFNEIKWRSYYSILNWRFRLLDPSMASQIQPDPYDVLHEMTEAQWMRGRSLSERVFKKVKCIVEHAYRHVPYYNRLYRTLGLHPDQLSTLGDLEKFPIVTKEKLRTGGDEVLADNIDRTHMSRAATSSSTGIPLIFHLDFNWAIRRFASKWLLDSHFGARPQTRYFAILNVPPPITNIHQAASFEDRLSSSASKLVNSELVNPLQNYLFSYLEITKERFPRIIKELVKFKPKYGSATPTQLQLISEILSDQPTPFPKLQAIICGSETLLDTERKRFEEIFGCPIFNRFGSREFYGAVAGECEYHLGMHVNLDLVMIEIVDDNNEPCSTGELGNIVITDFWNRSMPFIRYKIGDIGSLKSDCNCGRGFPMLGPLIGRNNEWVLNKDNVRIPVLSLAMTMMITEELAEHIRSFQFSQTKPGHLVMRMIPYPGWNESVLRERMTKIGRLNRIDFDFEIVDQITPFPSGKRRLLLD